MQPFTSSDYWKAIVLYGLNTATYKMALAKCLLEFGKAGANAVTWNDLASSFLRQYQARLLDNPMPQQGTVGRLTKLERLVQQENIGQISHDEAINKVAMEGFKDVVPRFQTIGVDAHLADGLFYEIEFGKKLVLKDRLLTLGASLFEELNGEIGARWNLLEGAYSISQSQHQYQLANDIRETYLELGHERTPLTKNVPFLAGYQGNVCFYCGEDIGSDIHVDHVLPRQIINHDEIWNLVLSHGHCNMQKSDRLVGPHFIGKLIARNENIMGSNHPWKKRIESQLGKNPRLRAAELYRHYDLIKTARGSDYWGGSSSYNPETDPFYRRLVTTLNNG